MKLFALATAAVATTFFAPTPAAEANTLFEVVSARANARAGGPTNQFDADTLARYGALSGTHARGRRSYSKRRKYNRKRHYKSFRGIKRRY